MPQNGCHVHPGKAKPSPTPTWVRLGLMGSLLGFPEVRAGLGWGFLGQGQLCGPWGQLHHLLVLGEAGVSPALALGSDISPATQCFSFPSRNEAIGAGDVSRRSPELSPHLIQPPTAMQD